MCTTFGASIPRQTRLQVKKQRCLDLDQRVIKLELQLAERSSQIGLLREEKELGREMEDRARNSEQEVPEDDCARSG